MGGKIQNQNAAAHAQLAPLAQMGQNTNHQITQGAAFITQDILKSAKADTVQQVKDMEPEIMMFLLTKAVTLFAVGSKRDDPIPDYFKSETVVAIDQIRKDFAADAYTDALRQVIDDPDQYGTGPQNPADKQLFDRLRAAASKELQGGIFLTKCLQRACQDLDGSSNPSQ